MMKSWGVALTGLGAFIAIVALTLMPSTVRNEEMTTLAYTGTTIGTGRYSETYNLPRAQLRELAFQGGCALFLGGILLGVGGALEDRLRAIGTFTPAIGLLHDPVPPPVDGVTADTPALADRYQTARADPELLAAEAQKNKELLAYGAGGIITVLLLVLLVAWMYGSVAGR